MNWYTFSKYVMQRQDRSIESPICIHIEKNLACLIVRMQETAVWFSRIWSTFWVRPQLYISYRSFQKSALISGHAITVNTMCTHSWHLTRAPQWKENMSLKCSYLSNTTGWLNTIQLLTKLLSGYVWTLKGWDEFSGRKLGITASGGSYGNWKRWVQLCLT